MGKSSYRNLHVDGVNYRYVIGKSFVKIVGPNGNQTVEKEKCGVKCYDDIVVSPSMIAQYIQGRDIVPEDFFDSCGHKGATLSVNPYASEIYSRTYYIIRCENCLNELAFDI